MSGAGTMAEIARQIIRSHFGCCTCEPGETGNMTNNYVYPFEAAGDQYFLKLYRNNDWPEEGKIPYVYQSLSQKNIPHAELIAYSRNDELYPNGYSIERRVQGTAADKMRPDREQEIRLYAGLADFMSSVHGIHIDNYGYIGSGTACYSNMADFLEDEFDGFGSRLKDIISEKRLESLKERILDTMRDFGNLPSVLCHGDLSKKNIMIRENGEITLIDWDDAMSLCWMADISRLTLWMKHNYNEQEYALFRNVFLEHYNTLYRKAEFDDFESAYHIYSALDSLIFAIKVEDAVLEKRLKEYLDNVDVI